MNEHIDDLLPFYITQTLGKGDDDRVRAHLAVCEVCRSRLAEWEKVARVVTHTSTRRAEGIQPSGQAQSASTGWKLSPLVYASLHRRPTIQQALYSAAHLIWSQRVFLTSPWLVPLLSLLFLFGAVMTLIFQELAENWVTIPLVAIMPIAAALSTGFLDTFGDDPAGEVVAAAPTSLAALLFARLTLALGTISLIGFFCSLLAAFFGQADQSLLVLVGSWLGPMLFLSALTTVLSLCLHPRIASGAVLLLWGSLLLLVFTERSDRPLLGFSLLWLLQANWVSIVVQMILAALLWLAAWLWLTHYAPAQLHPEGRS